ncbi:MAG: PAS domain-containing protein [Nitrospiraceae bacterium]|nr:PAS domain-containing protein [Nitrospiraceae bacterium]
MKNVRYGITIIGIFILIIAATAIELHYMRLQTVSIMTRILLVILFNLNIIALLTLMFYVGKSLLRIYIERKQKILGYKFKTKIVVVFVILTSIPSALLFFVASGLVTNYIDKLLTPQFRQPFVSTIEVAKTLYDMEKQRTLDFAKTAVEGSRISPQYKVTHLNKLPDNPSETVKFAFNGKEGTEVISSENGDIIRAVVPDKSSVKTPGVIVVETHLPKSISANVEKIKEAYEDYLKLESWKVPLKMNYMMILTFFTLIIVFMSLWVALRISRGITDPIQKLAQATEEVASGNLNFALKMQREDEIGLLINSFNHMVTELKSGKEVLQKAHMESDRRRLWMENILANINSGVLFLDISGKILTINSAAYSILNLNREDVIGKTYKELMQKIKSDELHALIRGIIIKDLSGVEKNVKVTTSEKNLTLRVFVTTLRDITHTPIGLLAVFDDITDIIRAQQNLIWEEAARRIAHEIKNPLTPIKLSAERMQKKWEQKDKNFGQIFEHATKAIVKEVDSLKKLVDDFSTLGKMPEIKKTPINIVSIIDEIIELYKGYKEFSIKTTIPDKMILVELDGEQFKRVLINIVDNAFQAMGYSGNIEIKVYKDDSANKLLIDIADDGPGITEEDKEKIFKPYFSTKKGGTGLGLAIANKIIAEHKGYIRVKDNNPNGAVFTISIPIKSYDL